MFVWAFTTRSIQACSVTGENPSMAGLCWDEQAYVCDVVQEHEWVWAGRAFARRPKPDHASGQLVSLTAWHLGFRF